MQQDYQMFKIVVIGSMGTGKTNISTRYIRNEYNQGAKSTVGVQFLSKLVQVRNQNIKVTLWDTAGQQRYKSLSKVYYKGASGILIVYDVTQPQSYLDVESWMRLANQNLNLNEVVLMVVGNKIDLEDKRKVPNDRAITQYKDKFDIDCWEVSAKTGYNVREVFAELVAKIYEMNVKVKYNSQIPDDQSYFGSVADGSVMVHDARLPNTAKLDTKTGNGLPAISEVEEVRRSRVGKNFQKQLVIDDNSKKYVPNGKANMGSVAPRKEKNMKLGSNDKKRDKKKEKSGGCC